MIGRPVFNSQLDFPVSLDGITGYLDDRRIPITPQSLPAFFLLVLSGKLLTMIYQHPLILTGKQIKNQEADIQSGTKKWRIAEITFLIV